MLARHAALVAFVAGFAFGVWLVLLDTSTMPSWLNGALGAVFYSYVTLLGPVLLVVGWLAKRFLPGPGRLMQVIGAAWTGVPVGAVLIGYTTCTAFCLAD